MDIVRLGLGSKHLVNGLNGKQQASWNVEDALVRSTFGTQGKVTLAVAIAEPFAEFVIDKGSKCVFMQAVQPLLIFMIPGQGISQD